MSSGAHRKFAAKPRTRKCATCGNRITSKPSKQNRYCSHACYAAQPSPRRNATTVQCGHCGKDFKKRPSELREGRGKFCSKTCAGLGRPIRGRSQIADVAIELWATDTPMLHIAEHRIGRWSIDLALPQLALAIELDGEYWHSLPNMVAKDIRKDAFLRSRGWTVCRIVMTKDDTPETIARQITEAVAQRHAA